MKDAIAFDTGMMPTQFGVGQPVRRSEDQRFVTGSGNYTDDIVLPNQLYGYVLRSPFAAATLGEINTDRAMAMAGVHLIVTGADLAAAEFDSMPCLVQLKNRDGSDAPMPFRPVLATQTVRFAGEPVAFVVADSRTAARDAAEAIEIDYDMSDAVVDTATADAAGQPQVHDDAPRNVAFDWHHGDQEGTDTAFAKAAHVTTLNLVNNKVVANAIETRAAIADWDDAEDRLTLHTNTQGGWMIRDFLAENFLKIDKEKIRVVTPDVGGGFGMKIFLYPEHVLVSYATRALKRPVKWTGDRSESFLADAMGRDHVTKAELALDGDNRILGLRVRTHANMGAYLSQFAPFIPTGAAVKVLSGIYDVKIASYSVIGVFTHTTPVDAYRGAGRPESNYMMERLVDKAAREVGMNPAEFRKLNLIAEQAMPFTTAVGEIYDSGAFATVIDAVTTRADVAGFEARKAQSERSGKRRGLGFACYIESTMGDPFEYADIRFEENGRISVGVGTQSNGQGHETAFAQVLSERLGISFDMIDIIQGDTDRIPIGGGTGGSRSLTAQAAAINVASDEVIEKAKNLAADEFETSVGDVEYAAGTISVVGTDRSTGLFDLAARHPGELDTRAKAELEAWTYPNGCHIAEVEIDEATGVPTVERYTIVDDFGKVVNPMLVAGQVFGGVVQGIGQALYEQAIHDDTGQLVTGSFMDYGMPKADQLPSFDFNYIEIPCKNNAMGIKGCGEAGTIASPPAVMNAVVDALWQGNPDSVPEIDMPVTAEKAWAALNA